MQKNRGGFTLVEIMIVVAIIALLASIAVPSFLRARKRSQAASLMEEYRLTDAAVDQYAIENNKTSSTRPRAVDIRGYIKESTKLYNRINTAAGATTFLDLLNNTVTIPSIDSPLAVPTNTFDALSDVAPASFWEPYTTGTT